MHIEVKEEHRLDACPVCGFSSRCCQTEDPFRKEYACHRCALVWVFTAYVMGDVYFEELRIHVRQSFALIHRQILTSDEKRVITVVRNLTESNAEIREYNISEFLWNYILSRRRKTNFSQPFNLE